MQHELVVADALAHRDDLIAINIEYLSWVFNGIEEMFGIPADDIVGMPASEYVPTVIDKVCGDPPPRGIFYLLNVDGGVAGMGGLRLLRTGVAEIKRLYVRPDYRGMKLGQILLQRLLSDAKAFGYHHMYLDSALFMKSAHRLYENAGFTDCDVYEGTEVPADLHDRWRFMERAV